MTTTHLSTATALLLVAQTLACNNPAPPVPSAYAAPMPGAAPAPMLPGAVPTYGAPPSGLPQPMAAPVSPTLQNVAATTARPPVPMRGRVDTRKVDAVRVARAVPRGQRAPRPVRVPVRRDGTFEVQLPRGARYAVSFEKQGRQVGVMSFPTRAGGATTHFLVIGLAMVVTPVVYELGVIDGLTWEYVPQYSPLLWFDQDGDGQFDFYDLDDDNDGSFDDADLDDDNDGLADAYEDFDCDDDGLLDFIDPDDDNDGLADLVDPDDDGDGTGDAADLDDDWGDADDDGIADELDQDDDNDGVADAIDPDDDGDGMGDAAEEALADDDGDGQPNAQDTDDDGDGAADVAEPADDLADAPGVPDDAPEPEAPGFVDDGPAPADDGAGDAPPDPGPADMGDTGQ